MKQIIGEDEFYSLSESQMDELKIWADEKGYFFPSQDPCLSIGQMIEFLGDHIEEIRFHGDTVVICDLDHVYQKDELADALWEAVKGVLERGD